MAAEIPAPTPADFAAAQAAAMRRAQYPHSQPTQAELAAINRILVDRARQRLLRQPATEPDTSPSP